MEINILAYQDLLLTKDAQIKQLESQIIRQESPVDDSALELEIKNLNKILLEKQSIIEQLKRKFKEYGLDESRETKENLKLRAHKKVEHINLEIEKRLE